MPQETATIRPGVYTFRELLNLADVDFEAAATVKRGDAQVLDHRRVSVGGLYFDDVNNVLVVPDVAVDALEIRAEGKLVGKLKVDAEAEPRHSSELSDQARLPAQPEN